MNIFRDYDIRGIYPDEINASVAERAGNAVAVFYGAKKIIIGEDGRLSSPDLRNGLIRGVKKAGTDAIFIGQTATPLFYFASKRLKASAGIMVTASHNPSQYNGLKIIGPDCNPVDLDSSLSDIKKVFDKGDFKTAEEGGELSEYSGIVDDYTNFLTNIADVKRGDIKLKLVVDAGNGMASVVLKPLFSRLNVNYTPLFFDIDGNFPGRGADPVKLGATDILRAKVLSEKADLGIAFDGDADRMTVIDENGDIIEPQYILGILWRNEKKLFGFPKVIYDLRFSKSVKELFGRHGCRSMVGHNHIRRAALDAGAELAGETSGHFYFRKLNYAESVNLALLKLLKAVSKKPLSALALAAGFRKYSYSGDINIPMPTTNPEGEQAPYEVGDQQLTTKNIIEKLKEIHEDGEINELDGLTVEYWDKAPTGRRWWFNIRPSNTEPLMRLVVEADTKELMGQKISELISEIE